MSRIPKFGFGFRRSKVEDEQQQSVEPTNINRSATPTDPLASRSAESSPKVARSKSLRLPRPQKYGLKSSSQSSISEANRNGYSNNEDGLVPDVKSVKSLRPPSDGLLAPRGRSYTVSSHVTSSSNQSSRSNSPSVTSVSVERRRVGVKLEGGHTLSQGEPSSSEVNKSI